MTEWVGPLPWALIVAAFAAGGAWVGVKLQLRAALRELAEHGRRLDRHCAELEKHDRWLARIRARGL